MAVAAAVRQSCWGREPLRAACSLCVPVAAAAAAACLTPSHAAGRRQVTLPFKPQLTLSPPPCTNHFHSHTCTLTLVRVLTHVLRACSHDEVLQRLGINSTHNVCEA